jgi:polar amino acid transport system substrate-binding protein
MAQTVIRLVADPYPPYQFEEAGTVKGIDHDIIMEAFGVFGLQMHTTLLPWDRCMKSMEEGLVDGVYQIVRTTEREKQFLYSDLLRTAKTAFYTMKPSLPDDQSPRIRLPFNPEQHTLGVLAGYSYNQVIDGLKPPNKFEAGDHAQLMKGLRDGRFELALMDQGVAEHLLSKHRIVDIVRIEKYTINRDLYVAFQKKRVDLAETFNSGLERILRTSTYKNTFAKYGVASTPTCRNS